MVSYSPWDWLSFSRGDENLRVPLWHPFDARYGSTPIVNDGDSQRLDPFSQQGFGNSMYAMDPRQYPTQPWNIPAFSAFSQVGDNQRINPETVKAGQWDPLTTLRSVGDMNRAAVYRTDMLGQLLGQHKAGDVILSDDERRLMRQDWERQVRDNVQARNAAMAPYVDASNAFRQDYDQKIQAAKEALRTAAMQDPRMAESLDRYDKYSNSPYIADAYRTRAGVNPIDAMLPNASKTYNPGVNQWYEPSYVSMGSGNDTWDANSLDRFYRSTDFWDSINSEPVDFGKTITPSASGYLNYLQGQGYDVSAAQRAVNDVANMFQSQGEQRGDSWRINWFPQESMTAAPMSSEVNKMFQSGDDQRQQAAILNQQAYDKLINKGQQGGTIPQDFSRPFYGQITGTQGWGSQGDAWNPNASWAMPNAQGMTYTPYGANAGVGWGNTGFGQQPAQRQNAPAAAWGGVFANQNPWGLS